MLGFQLGRGKCEAKAISDLSTQSYTIAGQTV